MFPKYRPPRRKLGFPFQAFGRTKQGRHLASIYTFKKKAPLEKGNMQQCRDGASGYRFPFFYHSLSFPALSFVSRIWTFSWRLQPAFMIYDSSRPNGLMSILGRREQFFMMMDGRRNEWDYMYWAEKLQAASR
jgi:hypothetical protein